jgi:predicted ester cyclase
MKHYLLLVFALTLCSAPRAQDMNTNKRGVTLW